MQRKDKKYVFLPVEHNAKRFLSRLFGAPKKQFLPYFTGKVEVKDQLTIQSRSFKSSFDNANIEQDKQLSHSNKALNMTDKQLTDQFLNAPKDSKPDFLGVGIHKTGTSWVHAMLKDHPQISMATNPGGAGQGKEFGFWLEDSNMDPKAYMHRFSCEDGNVKGEFTPSYAAKLKTLQLIRSSLPDVKIVCGLRDPRYIFHSAYLHERRGGSITSLTDYYNFVVSKNILDDSNLDRIVDNINKTFPSENIHYYFYSKMKNNPKKEIQKIYSFLGVDPDFTPKTLGVRINARYQFRSLFLYKATSTFLKYFYKGKNDFKQLINTPHLRPWWVSFLLKINEKNINKHKISPEEIKTLQDKNIMSMGEKTMSQFSKDHWEE